MLTILRTLRFEPLEPRQLLAVAPASEVAPPLDADFNSDGKVDAADLVLWQNNFGIDGAAQPPGSGDDFLRWQQQLGNVAAPPNWFDANVHDSALRTLGSGLYADALIDRSDMLALFQKVESDGSVTAPEKTDLDLIVGDAALFGSLDYVDKLASYIVLGNSANATYQGQPLGNLAADSTGAQLTTLVNKWFLGLDHPTASTGYTLAAGQLFVGGPAYTDVKQGSGLGDCSLLASLAETALITPEAITSMFIVNGDSTYTVRFYHDGAAEYVTADSYLPSGYAAIPNGELWVALAEKAFAQVGELSGFGRNNSYSSIASLYAFTTLGQITGQPTVAVTPVAAGDSLFTFETAYNANKLICLITPYSPPQGGIVGNHAYAIVGYDSATQTVMLFNPWGIQYGLTTLTWNQIQANFVYFDRTA